MAETHIPIHTPTGNLDRVSPALRRTHVLLTAQQHERLLAHAHARASSVSQIVREAIEAHIGPDPPVVGDHPGIGPTTGAARRFLAAKPLDLGSR